MSRATSSRSSRSRRSRPLPNRGLTRKAYIIANAFELMLALLAVFGTFSYFVWPRFQQQTAIALALKDWTWLWTAGYGLGGLGMVYGIVKPSPRVELMGLSFFAAAVTVNAVAVATVAGKLAIIPTLTYASIAAACLVRARLILKIDSR